MQKQELIDRLLDCSHSLQELAEHLQQTEIAAPALAEAAAPADAPTAEDKADDAPPAADPSAAAEPAKNANPLARLLAGYTPPKLDLPGGANPLQLFNLFGGKLPGRLGGDLPTTLAELHDNPEILSLLDRVAAEPQTLSALSALTGQDAQRLQAVLQSLTPAPTAEAAPAAPAAASLAKTPLPAAAPPVSDATAHLNSLLAEWHWQPYARVWQS